MNVKLENTAVPTMRTALIPLAHIPVNVISDLPGMDVRALKPVTVI